MKTLLAFKKTNWKSYYKAYSVTCQRESIIFSCKYLDKLVQKNDYFDHKQEQNCQLSDENMSKLDNATLHDILLTNELRISMIIQKTFD